MKKLHFNIIIHASRDIVWNKMLNIDTYKLWTKAFCDTSYYDGNWNKGSSILFLDESGNGMKAIIADNIEYELISIKLLACIMKDNDEEIFRTVFDFERI